MALNDEQRLRVRPDVLSRQLKDETVLLDLEGGTYFGLNEVGAEVWALLRQEATVGELRRRILGAYDVKSADFDRDLEALLSDLQQRGLIEAVAS